MADTKLTGLTELTAPTSDDLVYVVDAPGGTPASKKVTIQNLFLNVPTYDGLTGSLVIGTTGAALNHAAGIEGYNNTFIGFQAGDVVSTGDGNTFVGSEAGTLATTARYNTGIGNKALWQNVDGYACSAVGYLALGLHTGVGTAGGYNQAFGVEALYSNVSGNHNTACGFAAGWGATGSRNVFIGSNAGKFETGDNKIMIDNIPRDDEADGRSSALIYGVTNATPASQTLTLGGSGNVGIGILAPTDYMHIYLPTGAGAKGLTIDSHGDATCDPTILLVSTAGVTSGKIYYDTDIGDLCIQNDFANTAGDIVFRTSGANAAMQINGDRLIGIGAVPGGARLQVAQPDAGGAMPCLKLYQLDVDETFIDFAGTTAADQTKSISTVNGDGDVTGPKNFSASAGWEFVGMVKIDVNGSAYWMPYYQPDTA